MVRPAFRAEVNLEPTRPPNRTTTGRRICCWYCEGPAYARSNTNRIFYYENHKRRPNPEFCSKTCRAEWARLRATVGEE